MRWYGRLLGVVLTVAEYCVIGLAATAPNGERRLARAPAVRTRADRVDRIWYGGTLDPVVVEGRTSAPVGPVANARERQAPSVSICARRGLPETAQRSGGRRLARELCWNGGGKNLTAR